MGEGGGFWRRGQGQATGSGALQSEPGQAARGGAARGSGHRRGVQCSRQGGCKLRVSKARGSPMHVVARRPAVCNPQRVVIITIIVRLLLGNPDDAVAHRSITAIHGPWLHKVRPPARLCSSCARTHHGILHCASSPSGTSEGLAHMIAARRGTRGRALAHSSVCGTER